MWIIQQSLPSSAAGTYAQKGIRPILVLSTENHMKEHHLCWVQKHLPHISSSHLWFYRISNIGQNQSWGWALEMSVMRPTFFLHFDNLGKPLASRNTFLSAQTPGQHMLASLGLGSDFNSSNATKQRKSDCQLNIVKIQNSFSVRSPLAHFENVPVHSLARFHAKGLSGCRELQHLAAIEPKATLSIDFKLTT